MKQVKQGSKVLILSGFWMGLEGKIVKILSNTTFKFRVEIEEHATNDYSEEELLLM